MEGDPSPLPMPQAPASNGLVVTLGPYHKKLMTEDQIAQAIKVYQVH